jgi:lipoteichoic acid synthase
MKKFIARIDNIKERYLWLAVFATITAKCFYFQLSTQLNSAPFFSASNLVMMLSTVCTVVIFMSLILALFNRNRILMLLSLCVIISMLLVADTNYYRYYYGIITIPVLLQVDLRLVGSVNESILSLFVPYDIIYLVDLPLMFIWSIRLHKKRIKIDVRRRVRIAACAFSVCLAIFTGVQTTAGIDAVKYSNNYIAKKFGVLYSHIDATRMFINDFVIDDSKLTKEEADLVRKVYKDNSIKRSAKYRGSAAGMNLIVVQMEAIQEFVINRTVNGREITPNLNRLAREGLYFENLYCQTADGNTSDAEFIFNTSLYPISEGAVYNIYYDNTYNSLAYALAAKGYETASFHGFKPEFYNRNIMHKKLGFNRFVSEEDFILDDLAGWKCGALSDKSFFTQSLEIMSNMKEPYYAFLITLSSHHPFTWFEDYDFDVGKYQGTYLGNYLKAANYLDSCIGLFIEELEKRGLDDRSLIVLYGDHPAIPRHQSDELMEFLGIEFSELSWLKLKKVPCIMLWPGLKNSMVVDTICGQVDLLPTIANLMGLDYRYYLGRDLLNSQTEYAVFRDGSLITDSIAYFNDSACVYDTKTGELLDIEEYDDEILKLLEGLDISDVIIENDAFRKSEK